MNNFRTVKISPLGIKLHLVCGDHDFIKQIIIGTSGEEVASMAMEKVDICDALALSSEADGSLNLHFICGNPNIEAGIIVHESYHILNMCFKYIFYEHQDNDELEAYMIESIFEYIYNFLEEAKSDEKN